MYTQFEQIPDQRKRRGVRYPLAMLLTMALLAKLAGASQVRAIAEWARERAEELAALYDVQRPSMPHPTTWSRVLANAVAVEALERALAPLLAPPSTAEEPARASRPIALDGKTLRGTIPIGYTSGVHLLSAYQVDSGVALAQAAVASKENESVAAPRLLKSLKLCGAMISGDVTLHEDASQVRLGQAPEVLATLNNAVCGLLARAGLTNLAALQRSFAATFGRLLFQT